MFQQQSHKRVGAQERRYGQRRDAHIISELQVSTELDEHVHCVHLSTLYRQILYMAP